MNEQERAADGVRATDPPSAEQAAKELQELREKLFDGWAVLMRAMDACSARLAQPPAAGVKACEPPQVCKWPKCDCARPMRCGKLSVTEATAAGVAPTPSSWDEKALATAQAIAAIRYDGVNRSQLISQVQLAVLEAMRWAAPAGVDLPDGEQPK